MLETLAFWRSCSFGHSARETEGNANTSRTPAIVSRVAVLVTLDIEAIIYLAPRVALERFFIRTTLFFAFLVVGQPLTLIFVVCTRSAPF
jgi:hypothetical protein